MATVTQRRARSATPAPEIPEAPRPRRRRLRLLATATVGGLMAIVALLPTLVSRSPVAGWLVSQATSDLQGEVSVGSIHLGWFSAPVLADIEIRDTEQRPLLEIEHVRAERSLLICC
jgi:hypothetical protein